MQANAAENLAVAHAPQLTSREERGRQIAKLGGIKQLGSQYVVPSQSTGASVYLVDVVEETCTCADYELRRQQCKHYHATMYWIAWSADVDANGNVTETLTITATTKPKKKPAVKRDSAKYNKVQFIEGSYVPQLLRALCDGIVDPPRKPGRGRKPIPAGDSAFVAVMKVYSLKSQRRVQSDLADNVAKGNLEHHWNYNEISKFLRDEATTPLLSSLIEESAKPLAAIENGCFAIDSTGFSTVTYERYFDFKHGKLMARHPWVKLHIAVGTATHVISAVKVSDEGDCPVMPELVEETMENFDVEEVCADKAYSSKENHTALHRCGIKAFIPFKVNAVVDPKCPVWSQLLYEFVCDNEKFLQRYHRRSQVETVNQMLKSKFGASVASKDSTAQVNEVLCKCLLHNLNRVVYAIVHAGITPKFWQHSTPAPAPTERPKLTLVPMPMEN